MHLFRILPVLIFSAAAIARTHARHLEQPLAVHALVDDGFSSSSATTNADDPAPAVVLTSFRVFDEPVKIPSVGPIQLTCNQNFFSFEFIARPGADSARMMYAHKLEGFDKDWVNSGARRYASYTNLDGGSYVFRAKATGGNRATRVRELAIHVIIVPAWYNTWFFRLTITLGCLIIVFWGIRFRIGSIEKQRKALELAVDEKTRLLSESNENLRKSEETFRAMAENASDVITRVDRSYRIQYLNQASITIAGLTKEDGIGKTISELGFPEELASLWVGTLDRVIETGRKQVMEFQLPNGVWLESMVCPEFDPAGNVVTLISTSRDITARRQAQIELAKAKETAEQALEESRRLTAIIESTSDLVGMADMQGRLVYMNRAGRLQVGISESQTLEGVRFDSLYNAESMKTMMEIGIPYAIEHGTWSGELTLVHQKTGREIPISLAGLVHYDNDGKPQYLSAILRDISEQKRIQNELAEGKAEARRLADIIESTSDYVGIADLQGNSIYVNKAGLRMVGKDENVKHRFNVSMCHPERVRGALLESLSIVMQGSTWTGETHILHRDGHEIPVSAAIFPLFDSHGQVTAIAAMFRDITGQKRGAEELQAAKEQAEIANRAKSQFLANMSHELRTPLNGILGYTQILQKDRHLQAIHREQVSIIESCGEHLLNLINEILDLSKIESGRMELQDTDFNFTDFLEGIAEMISIRARQKGLSFMFETVTALPVAVRADEKRLRQILINLLGNAVKYTEEGGVVLKVGHHEGSMCFQVEDTGIGIARDRLDEIFLPFYQLQDAARSIDGTGLGLAITRQLVELMGGTLTVQSEPGNGSIFRLKLKLIELESVVKRASVLPAAVTGYRGRRRKVLIADDKNENRSVLVNMLKNLGFECREASDGMSSLQLLADWTPDIVFMDLRMPGLSGFETTRRIRSMDGFANLPIIAISASAFEFTRKESLEAGCNEFISKPFREKQLLEILRQFLNLEWVVETTDAHSQEQAADPGLLPSPDVMEKITLLANVGDLGGLMILLEQMNGDERMRPFVNYLLPPVRNFEVTRVRELIKACLTENEAGAA